MLAVRVDDAAGTADYETAFQALGREEAQILVCDSAEMEVQQALRAAVEEASASRRERIALVGGDGDTAAELVERAAALNSERMVLVGADGLSSAGVNGCRRVCRRCAGRRCVVGLRAGSGGAIEWSGDNGPRRGL